MNIFDIMPYLKKFDIVHVHLFPANYWTAIAKLLSFNKVPLVTTEHSTNNKRRSIAIFKYIDSIIYRNYSEVIACADKALETFNKRYPQIHSISIPNGVNIQKYTNAKAYTKNELLGISDDCFIVTMIARFAYPKRQDSVIEAISKLPEKFHGVFVGGDVNDANLIEMQKLSKKMGVSDRIHFL